MKKIGLCLILLSLCINPVISVSAETLSDESVEVLITADPLAIESDSVPVIEIVADALINTDGSYAIEHEVTDDIFLTTVSKSDLVELQDNPTIIVQRNQLRSPMTTADVLNIVNASDAHALPYQATGSDYAIAIIDTGVRATHEFFTENGTTYDVDTNPSRVTVEHCQSGGLPITDTEGEYILDGSGNKLYEGISMCNGNVSVATDIDGVTYYSNSIPGTTTPAFGQSAPCLADYPGFTTGCMHGTHVAGIASGTSAVYASDSTERSGIAPTADIISFNVFTKFADETNCSGSSSCLLATDADILSALSQIEDLATNGTKISAINMSLGGGLYSDQEVCKDENILYYYAFARLKELGVPTIIASGNNSSKSQISAPACLENAYSVGATTSSDAVASYSNIASFLDFLAPGSSISSAVSSSDSGFSSFSGTSMATPVVAGAFGVLVSLFDGTHTGYAERSIDAIVNALKQSGVSVDDARTDGVVTGLPRIDILGAISYLTETPYIQLPNSITIAYPLAYSFTVSGPNAITSTNITVDPSSTVTYEDLVCNSVSVSEYDCSVSVTGSGSLVLSVIDDSAESYTTESIEFPALPSIDSISTTLSTGTYDSDDTIPITVTLSGNDAPISNGGNIQLQFNNTATVTVSTSDSSSSVFTGTYDVGDSASGQDIDQLRVTGIVSASYSETDGTDYSTAEFALSTSESNNLGQGGKVIAIDVTPVVATSSSGGGGGGGGVSVPVAPPTVDELKSFCTMALPTTYFEGSTSVDVLLLESALTRMGHFTSLPNRDYNSATTLAIKSFQSRYIPSKVSGIVDIQTWELIQFYGGCGSNDIKREISGLKYNTTKSILEVRVSTITKPQKVGTRSPEIQKSKEILVELGYLQSQTRITTLFTTKMKSALKKFQKKHKLSATGTLNKKTYQKLMQESL